MSMNAMKESVTTIPSGSSLQVRFLQAKRRAPVLQGDDIVYSANKYRETDGS